jgi:1,4-dihydroxy-2-naphthoate octaprenyltransferase
MAVTVSIHLINEYADVETDALTQRTAYSGGSGALSETGASPAIALTGAWIALLAGVLIAVIGVLTGLISVQALGMLMLGTFFGWMYSVRPLALAWKGWGELDNSLLGAMLLPLFGYVLARGTLNLSTLFLFLPFTGLAFLNLLAITWADREADGIVGKQTLAVKWSERSLRRLYLTVGTLSYLIIVFQFYLQFPRYVILVGFLTFPLSIWGFHTYTRKQDPAPSVIAMSVYMTLQLGVWLILSRT